MDFVVEISTFQKKFEITFGGVGWMKTVAWDPGGAWGPLWTNYDGLGTFWKKKKLTFFAFFFKHFWSNFSLILKVFSHEEVEKWNFFKTKPCIANPYDRKLDMVPYFAPLVTFDLKMKIEKQVRFSLGHQNVFFELVWKRMPKTHFELQTSNFEKNYWSCSGGVWWSKNVSLDPGGALEPIRTI